MPDAVTPQPRNLRLDRVGDWWALHDGDAVVRTPGRNPVVSRHRALLEEVLEDVARHGVDPMAKTTTFSLQASYLDFGLPVRREVLEENTFSIWPDDLLAGGAAATGVAAGGAGLDRAAFREALRRLTLRQLMATMTAGRVLRSALLGLRVVTGEAPLLPLARMACGRLADARSPGAAAAGRLHVPTDRDEGYCAGPCAAGAPLDPAGFARRCALHPLLDKMRRWCAFAEEVERR